MKFKQSVKKLAIILICIGAILNIYNLGYARSRPLYRFICGRDKMQIPTTILEHSIRGRLYFIRWTRNINKNWPPLARCRQVSQKLQENLVSGDLIYIVPSRSSVNNQPVLCASQKMTNVQFCPDPQILMTLQQGDNAQKLAEDIVAFNIDTSSRILDQQSPIFVEKEDVKGIDVDIMILRLKPAR